MLLTDESVLISKAAPEVNRLIFQVFGIFLEIIAGRKHYPAAVLPAELFLNFGFPPKVIGAIVSSAALKAERLRRVPSRAKMHRCFDVL